ncbi:leucine-rich repeat domain-containing protein [Streptomyces piniterrae]|uniref:Leucine-rich repeat domain-containing protein n=1 Tax=Streptomyces piniterrae TaxID=2571125 RepID=A0A4V5MLE9_9ACTN|nr:STM4015 family protein [Streptomyces piniterrae]TJZ56948.1 leucine-rich repeat domain-containing protein [Streptomyces piniterrae]
MSIHEHVEELDGLPVYDFREATADTTTLPEPGAVAWRLSVDPYDDEETFAERWQRFTETVELSGVRALVVGPWGETYENTSAVVVEAIVAAKDRLGGLRAIFLGDMVMEESEISWIQQSDVTPLLTAFPALRSLSVRGGEGLVFPPVRHEALRELRFESGGLPAAAVRGICESDFPALESLTLWLGVPEYGGDYEVTDLAAALAGSRFPALRHLGLQNSEIQDEIAAAVAAAPVVAGLETLDLSMGILTDAGAEALLGGQPLTHLKWLDLDHHFLTDAMVRRIRVALEPSGVEVVINERGEEDEDDGTVWRYAAVTE